MTSNVQGAGGARRLVILGVAASDSHVVANQLIAHSLRAQGFEVVNLGACTPVDEFARACAEYPDAEAVLIGSLNGHAADDLGELLDAKQSGGIHCPVILGGNLSVGSQEDPGIRHRLYALGVDRILDDPTDLPALLDELRDGFTGQVRAAS